MKIIHERNLRKNRTGRCLKETGVWEVKGGEILEKMKNII
jgi:hypothetical protein